VTCSRIGLENIFDAAFQLWDGSFKVSEQEALPVRVTSRRAAY
jgi:hypothetical protein